MQKQSSLLATVQRAVDERAGRVEIRIDGESLIALLREAELPHARGEGVEALAGNYGWPLLTARLVRLLSGDSGEGVLLNCTCGLPECWPLAMSVRLQARHVVWEGFQQRRRVGRWDYRMLQPMRFARGPYFDEVSRLSATLKRSWRAQSRAASPADVDVQTSCAL